MADVVPLSTAQAAVAAERLKTAEAEAKLDALAKESIEAGFRSYSWAEVPHPFRASVGFERGARWAMGKMAHSPQPAHTMPADRAGLVEECKQAAYDAITIARLDQHGATKEEWLDKIGALIDRLASSAAQVPEGRGPMNDDERLELLDHVSACQSAYHIDSTPGHRFGGLPSLLEENRAALVEYVNDLLAAAPAAAQVPSDTAFDLVQIKIACEHSPHRAAGTWDQALADMIATLSAKHEDEATEQFDAAVDRARARAAAPAAGGDQ